MANTIQAKKRIRQNSKRRLRNTSQRSSMRTHLKRVVTAIKNKNAQIIVDSDSKLISWRSPILQILINLLDNSLKYSKKDVDPIIKISVNEQTLGWILKFEDNGIGINEKYFKKIFIIFQRLHTREEYEGSGVGLAITKKLVESLGGKINLSSTPGEGTIFNIFIPKKI